MNAREKAAACFAKARSTTSEHERDNAVTLGTRIAQAAGLSLDLFDIPGRARASAKPQEAPRREQSRPSWHRTGTYEGYNREAEEAVNAQFANELARMRRHFQEQAKREAAKAARSKPRPLYQTAEAAAAFLRTLGAEVRTQPLEPGGSRLWAMVYKGQVYGSITDAKLVEGAIKTTPPEVRMRHDLSEAARIAREAAYYSAFYG